MYEARQNKEKVSRVIKQLKKSNKREIEKKDTPKTINHQSWLLNNITFTNGRNRILLQKKVDTVGGTFDTEKYQPINDIVNEDFRKAGADISISFMPNETYNMDDIGLVQTTKLYRSHMKNVEQYEEEPTKLKRMTPNGTMIDQTTFVNSKLGIITEKEADPKLSIPQTNPIYHSLNPRRTSIAKSLFENIEQNDYGSIHKGGSNDKANLRDYPYRIVEKDENIVHQFEVCALDLNKNTYIGSVTWGYEGYPIPDNDYHVALLDFEGTIDAKPSDEFVKAAKLWNNTQISIDNLETKTVKLPVPADLQSDGNEHQDLQSETIKE